MTEFIERNNGTHQLMRNGKLSDKDCTDIRNYIKLLEGENKKYSDSLKKYCDIVVPFKFDKNRGKK